MIKSFTVQLAQISVKLIGDEMCKLKKLICDTEKSVSNSLFFACAGEKFDAHQYLIKRTSQVRLVLVVQQENSSISVLSWWL